MLALSFKEHAISDLSRHFMLDPSTLVPAVDALERKGLAKRGRDPRDRRRIPIALTERGADLLACVPLVDGDDPLFQSLSLMEDEQRQQLLMLMRELVGYMPDGENILKHVSSHMDWIHSHTEREITEIT
jgi:DNA-binding MarR family transcriptional regulator